MTRAQAVKKLRKLADALEDDDKHRECEFIEALADQFDKQEPIEMEDLVKFILKWSWFK